MSINEKIKAINKKMEKNKARYDLARQTAEFSALTRKVGKYEFLTEIFFLPEQDLL